MTICVELRAAAEPIWGAQLEHPFVRGVADGTLDPDRFRRYVRQDYLFLIDYGRTLAFACARFPHLDDAERFAELARSTLQDGMALHRSYAAEWASTEPSWKPSDRRRRPAPTPTSCSAPELWPTMPSSSRRFSPALGLQLARPGARRRRRARARSLCPLDRDLRDELAALAAWCRAVCDEVGAEACAAGRGRMREAFLESSCLELRFWEASWRLEQPA